jgi:hypothetical protein
VLARLPRPKMPRAQDTMGPTRMMCRLPMHRERGIWFLANKCVVCSTPTTAIQTEGSTSSPRAFNRGLLSKPKKNQSVREGAGSHCLPLSILKDGQQAVCTGLESTGGARGPYLLSPRVSLSRCSCNNPSVTTQWQRGSKGQYKNDDSSCVLKDAKSKTRTCAGVPRQRVSVFVDAKPCQYFSFMCIQRHRAASPSPQPSPVKYMVLF